MYCVSYTSARVLDFTGARPKDARRPLRFDPEKLASVKWRKTFEIPQNEGEGGEKTTTKNPKGLQTVRETAMNLEERESNGTSEL